MEPLRLKHVYELAVKGKLSTPEGCLLRREVGLERTEKEFMEPSGPIQAVT